MNTQKNFGPKGWTPEQLGSLAGKTYVITGANAGTGFEATRVFLSKGAKAPGVRIDVASFDLGLCEHGGIT